MTKTLGIKKSGEWCCQCQNGEKKWPVTIILWTYYKIIFDPFYILDIKSREKGRCVLKNKLKMISLDRM